MRTADDQQAAEFFARLANTTDWLYTPHPENLEARAALRKAYDEELAALVPDFKQVLARTLSQPAAEQFLSHRDRDIHLSNELSLLIGTVRRTILNLLRGHGADLGVYTLTGWLEGGTLTESLEPYTDEEHGGTGWLEQAQAKFYQLLRLRPFPFGLCRFCHKVFVQPDRGKPRRYCSDTCKQKGIPSAAKRTEYARAWRHRMREQELDTTQRILLAWPERTQYWPRLQKEFPRKSRRQLLYLIKKAEQDKRPQTKEEART